MTKGLKHQMLIHLIQPKKIYLFYIKYARLEYDKRIETPDVDPTKKKNIYFTSNMQDWSMTKGLKDQMLIHLIQQKTNIYFTSNMQDWSMTKGLKHQMLIQPKKKYLFYIKYARLEYDKRIETPDVDTFNPTKNLNDDNNNLYKYNCPVFC